ncbi:MAG: hypothetical protein M0Q91_14535 [Methanoregula sp.]|nr:hypothetical protein [Methanoregula sp.]
MDVNERFGVSGDIPVVGRWAVPPVTGCDYPAGPYINFVIENVSFPACYSGAWHPAVCADNALIRYALAARDSISYYDTLLPWMWKRNLNCPDPGYSYAVANPYNKAIYIAGVKNTDTGWFHAVDAEHLIVGNPSYSVWQDWKFFNYDNLDIKIGNYQIPAGTAICRTKIWITSVDSIFGCGDSAGMTWKTFYIDSNKNILSSQDPQCAESSTLNQTGKSLTKSQDETAELKKALQLMDNYGRFAISKWEFDQINEKMIFYTYDIRDKRAINDLQGTLVDNYTIQMIHDTEFETTRADVQKQLIEFRNNPEYQIGGISMVTDAFGDPAGNYAELWVYDLTPENKKIDNTVINGWTILVYPVSMK